MPGEIEKQFFVFSNAGKPIYSFHDSEETLSSIMATAEALMSVVSETRSDSLRYIRRGARVVAFLDKSPVCLVAVSTLSEPPAVLRMQLVLLHGQLTSLLTASAMDHLYTRNPGFDARRLLGGADVMLDALIRSFTASPAALLGAYHTLTLPRAVRSIIHGLLKEATVASKALFGLLIAGERVVGVTCTVKEPLQQWDILLLLNFVRSNVNKFKMAETITPLCLPMYNPNGHLHAYIHFLDTQTDILLVLLAGGSTPDFSAMSRARQQFLENMTANAMLRTVRNAVQEEETNHSVSLSFGNRITKDAFDKAQLNTDDVLHWVYKLSRPQQFVSSPWNERASTLQQEVLVAYSQIRAAMFDHAGEYGAGPLQTLRYELRPSFALIALSGTDAELYLVLEPLVDKPTAVRTAGELARALKEQHSEFFFQIS